MISNYSLFEQIKQEFKSKFDYGVVQRSIWNKLVHDSMKIFDVYFDTENDDVLKDKYRIITIPQNQWSHTKCSFKCWMAKAGGDWENPVIYFRCQLAEGYAYGLNKYGNSMFVFIPNRSEGNYHLVDCKRGQCAPSDSERKGHDQEPSEEKCWQSLKDYLMTLVNTEIAKNKHEYDREERDQESTKDPQMEGRIKLG